MQSLRNLALAGATALALAPATARGADLPMPPPMFRAPVVEDYGAWYLRGDIGIHGNPYRVGQCVEDSLHRDFLNLRMEQGPHTYKSSHCQETVQ